MTKQIDTYELSHTTETGMHYTACYAPLTLGGLFEGIGGFPLAATWAGIKPLWSNEIDNWACKVLRKNFNHRIIENDIRNIGKQNLEPVDIISGGFPCQPFSVAGNRKGKDDSRYLWPEMLRIVTELKPKYIIGENVAGLLTMENGKTIERILSDLEIAGYSPEIFLIPACGVGAWHKRERLWITAYTSDRTNGSKPGTNRKKDSLQELDKQELCGRLLTGTNNEPFTNSDSFALQGRLEKREDGWSYHGVRITSFDDHENWKDLPEPTISGGDNGVSDRVDRTKGLGNSIVPQVAFEIFKAINMHEASLSGA
jgi:DNA (cytosine-5)-methyltransferase 1